MEKLLLCIFICVSSKTFTQITFSHRLPIVSGTVFHSIHLLQGNHYFVTGGTVDTAGINHYDVLSALFDESGELINSQHFGESATQSIPQYHSLSLVSDVFIQQSYGSRNDTSCAIYHWFNIYGDTIRSRYLRSPYLPNGQIGASFINPKYSLIMPDSSVYLSTTIAQPSTANDVCIFHLDKYGNELWHYIYASEDEIETCYAMIPWDDGVMLAIFKSGTVEAGSRDVLLKLNNEGLNTGELESTVWSNYSFGLRSLLYDDALICAGSYWEHQDLLTSMFVWKMTPEGSVLWSTLISEPDEVSRTLDNLVKVEDGNYVVCGQYTWNDGDDDNEDIRVAKVNSENGSVMWSRMYHLVESSNDRHDAIDLKATPDGGVVFCGQAMDVLGDPNDVLNPRQQGWICKLDACGCLVPGCDENCVVGTTENVAVNQQRFKVGPNPANDFLNVYVSPHALTDFHKASFVLYDLQGRVVKSFSARQGDTTYILDVGELSAGRYQLVLQNDGMAVETMAVEVNH